MPSRNSDMTPEEKEAIMDGDIDELTQQLVASDQAEHLKSMEVA